jgi:hypothetical protein
MTTTRYEKIWRAGQGISGGFGFWSHYALKSSWYMQELVRAWVDALTELGYTDYDIVFYGDWTDGRHIADAIEPNTRYAAFKKEVKRSARHVHDVAAENANNYYKQPETMMTMNRIFRLEDQYHLDR